MSVIETVTAFLLFWVLSESVMLQATPFLRANLINDRIWTLVCHPILNALIGVGVALFDHRVLPVDLMSSVMVGGSTMIAASFPLAACLTRIGARLGKQSPTEQQQENETMAVKVEDDQITFSSGRTYEAELGIFGLSPDLEVFDGYDSRVHWEGRKTHRYGDPLTVKDMCELADVMIERWTRFKQEHSETDRAQRHADPVDGG